MAYIINHVMFLHVHHQYCTPTQLLQFALLILLIV